jgi:enoyl-CoA hydratase/carnithine racemase
VADPLDTEQRPDLLQVDRVGQHVALLTLTRPDKKNALSVALRDEISDRLDDLALDDDLRAVVVTGSGDAFCSGFDLSEFERGLTDEVFGRTLWRSSDRYHHRVMTMPIPTIAAVNGAALAGGFDLAVMCDVRLAAPEARFAHPERTFGPVVYGPLHDLVGGSVARDLCLTGRELAADEALAVGLVSAVVEGVVDEALAVAERTAQASRELLAGTKAKILRRAGIDPSSGTLDL